MIDEQFALPNGKPVEVIFSNGLPPEGKMLSMPYNTFKTAIYEIGLEVIGENWELYPKGQKYRGKLTAVKKALNEQAKAVNGEKAAQRSAWAKACGVAEK